MHLIALFVTLLASPVSSLRLMPPMMQMRSGSDPTKPPAVTAEQAATSAIGRVEPTNKPASRNVDSSVLVQGGTLKTWSYRDASVEQVQVVLSSEGRPIEANIELYHGPDNTPCKMQVYVENGGQTPFSAVIETPRYPNTVAIRNIGEMVFPFVADVFAENVDRPSEECYKGAIGIQGGALRTYPFDPRVDSVEILLTTDGRPLNARVELLQGPSNKKQIIDLYTEDGLDRPFFCVLETPGAGTVVRIVNTGPVEFPLTASLVPHTINDGTYTDDDYDGLNEPVVGGMGRW